MAAKRLLSSKGGKVEHTEYDGELIDPRSKDHIFPTFLSSTHSIQERASRISSAALQYLKVGGNPTN